MNHAKDLPIGRALYVNLPVLDVPRARAFFEAVAGFSVVSRFTNEQAACMRLRDRVYLMLLQRSFFATFTPRALCDTASTIEGLFAITCDSRAEVDATVARALTAGATEARAPSDHGFMYARSVFDLDGHQWELLWIDEASAPGAEGGAP